MRQLRHLSLVLTLISSVISTDDDRDSTGFSGGETGIYPFNNYYPNNNQHHSYHHSISAGEAPALLDTPAVAEARGAEGCRFPLKWEGNWFQSGGGSDIAISITRNTINTKGRCLEADGEKYLIFNERESCYRCVVFHEKHFNVLRYKETLCISERRSVKDFCASITGDATLHAMFRLDAVPIECPFKGSYTFYYNRGNKDCKYPISTVESCIHSSRVQLNFQACPDVPGSESKSEELQCLATWREGSSRYLLGLLKFNHPASFEERFRCFVYDKTKKYGPSLSSSSSSILSSSSSSSLSSSSSSSSSASSSYGVMGNSSISNTGDNSIFRLAQSADATCNGISWIEFSQLMTLRKTPIAKPCQFPSWLQSHAQWHTLDQRSTFLFDSNSGLRVYNSSDLSGVGPNSLTMTAMCSQILENPTLSKVMLILHSTSDCISGYLCSAIYRRDGHIVEIQLGNIARKADDACHHHYFNESELPFITLVSSTPETRQCPNVGRFQITGFSREGKKIQQKCSGGPIDSLNMGCNSLDTLQLKSECYSSDLTAEYACHGTWEEMGMSYLIATPLSRASTAARRYCFVFRESTMPDFRFGQNQRPSKYQQGGSYKYNNMDEETGSGNGNLLDPNDPTFSNIGYGRILQFSLIADSCRRNILPGIEGAMAFNVTENGRCNDYSRGLQIPLPLSYQNVIILVVLSVLGF